jgi:hypothetical protein
METILLIIFLAIVVAALSGGSRPEPPIYRIELVPPEQPRGHGHLVAAVVLMLLIILMLAAG